VLRRIEGEVGVDGWLIACGLFRARSLDGVEGRIALRLNVTVL